jgi:transposase
VDTYPKYGIKEFTMPKAHRPYPPEFRRRLVELVRSGRSPESLAQQFEPTAQAIRNWVRQADRDEGRRTDGLTTEERTELQRLRRETRTLREEREILKKAAAWVARETGSIPSGSSNS